MSETFLVGLFSRKGALSLLRGLSPEQGCWAGPLGVPSAAYSRLCLCLDRLTVTWGSGLPCGMWRTPAPGGGGRTGQEAVERVDPWSSSVAATGRRPFPPGSPRLFRAFLSALDGVAVPAALPCPVHSPPARQSALPSLGTTMAIPGGRWDTGCHSSFGPMVLAVGPTCV